MRRAAWTGLAAAALLAGCAQAPKPLYHWGGYQDALYAHLKGDGASPEQQLQQLGEAQQKAAASGAALPPGFRAHVGLLQLRLGRDAEARQQFEAEKAQFPESAPYIDSLLKRMDARKS